MQTIIVCPSTLRTGHSTYSKEALKLLFNGKSVSHIIKGTSPDKESEETSRNIQNIGRISLSGAQPKFSALVDKGHLRLTHKGEQGVFILKPRPVSPAIRNKDYCCANENLTMQIASQVYGIETASNALCFFEADGTPAYITRRFDIHPKGKFKQEDFASLMGRNSESHGENYKYDNVSYEECADIIRRYVKPALVDLRKFFKIVIYNFLILNDDAHLKNFSLIERNGEYRLAPAYDLINTNLQLYEPHIFAFEKGLFKEGMAMSDVKWINREDFEEFGRRIGLPIQVIKNDLDFFSSFHPLAEELIQQSFLSEELKKSYLDSYRFQIKMLSFSKQNSLIYNH
ncbi:MAG: HipA domain-containing protein [Muribaculaceae bacterium]|nr:HipA domain-containing protein [Muribaculaceae bacterium]